MSRRPLHRVTDAATGRVLAARIRLADTHWTRFRGLIGTPALAPDEGLWIVPCRQVHMFWMRYAIDVVFLDADLRVVAISSDLKPWRISPSAPTATSVLELAAGAAAAGGLRPDARLTITPVA